MNHCAGKQLRLAVWLLVAVTAISVAVAVFSMRSLGYESEWVVISVSGDSGATESGAQSTAAPVQALAQVRQRVKPNVQMLLPSNSCSCAGRKALQLHSDFQPSELPETRQRRDQQFQEFLRRRDAELGTVRVAPPNSPLSYPTQGVLVRPEQSVLIPGLRFDTGATDTYAVTLSAQRGVLDTVTEVEGVSVQGAGSARMALSGAMLHALNAQLRAVVYTNKVYVPGAAADIVLMESGEHRAQIPIRVQHPDMPRLYDGGADGDISRLVTVVTKTFLRYDKLRGLIGSVRGFYPNVTIVVADDSENPEAVREPGVEHYLMPFGKGWFAGRNLAISQVMTKYLLWVDDDFLFTKDTVMERMVEVLETTGMDVVGGKVANNAFQHKLQVVPGGPEEGDCLFRKSGSYQTLDGFPSCAVVDVVVNFFMARTTSMRAVGFDPQFSRIGHTEFFIDGLGKLRVATCSDVSIGHAAKQPGTQTKYNKFRHSREAHGRTVRALFFKNHLKCYQM